MRVLFRLLLLHVPFNMMTSSRLVLLVTFPNVQVHDTYMFPFAAIVAVPYVRGHRRLCLAPATRLVLMDPSVPNVLQLQLTRV